MDECFLGLHKLISQCFQLISNTSTDFRILAIDGSDIQIATNPSDLSSYHPETNGKKAYNLLHLNALYDLENHIYTDAVIQGKRNENEHSAFQEMVDNSAISKALETIVTNLDNTRYTPYELKKLYAARWGIETSFR